MSSRKPIRSGDLKALEARRLRSAELFAKGWSASRVARELGVSAQSACRWRQKWLKGGMEALRSVGRMGREPALSEGQLGQLQDQLLKGPKAHGYTTDLWTLRRIQKLIRKLFGVSYSTGHIWRLLGKMGWSCQKPARRAKERDENAIAQWKKHEWPRIKRGRKKRAP